MLSLIEYSEHAHEVSLLLLGVTFLFSVKSLRALSTSDFVYLRFIT